MHCFAVSTDLEHAPINGLVDPFCVAAEAFLMEATVENATWNRTGFPQPLVRISLKAIIQPLEKLLERRQIVFLSFLNRSPHPHRPGRKQTLASSAGRSETVASSAGRTLPHHRMLTHASSRVWPGEAP